MNTTASLSLFDRTRRNFVMTIAAVACLAATTASAVSTYDNLDPTPTPFLYANFGTWVGNFLPNLYASSGTTFVPTTTGALAGLDVGMTLGHTYGTSAVTLRLSNDVGGLPSSPIWQTNASVPAGPFGALLSLTGLGGPTLVAGQTYWLMADTPLDGVTMQQWYANNQGDFGPVISAGTQFASANRWSLRVDVAKTIVPEPSAAIGACVAALCLLVRRRVTK